MSTTLKNESEKRKSPTDSNEDNHVKKILTRSPSDDVLDVLKELKLPSNYFLSGKAEASLLDVSDPDYKSIFTYFNRSKNHHGGAKLLNILKVRTNLSNSAQNHLDDPENIGKYRMMLWHGTSSNNIENILSQGLKLPTKKGFFGAGIYFSDNFSYSLDYCGTAAAEKGLEEKGYLFLTDVLLGDIHKSFDLMDKAPNYEIKCPKTNKLLIKKAESIQGVGWYTPDPQGDKIVEGCVWPLGKKMANVKAQEMGQLVGNEFVIYDEKKAIPKFLVVVQKCGHTTW